MNIVKVEPLKKEFLESIGFDWHTDSDGSDYISDEIIEISEDEANSFYDASNELYDMFVEAGQYVIDNNLFFEIGIPFNLIESIKLSWENDVHWHLYGRFDFAGGVDGKPLKLLEFNADTPTSLFESAIIQWALLKQNGYDESLQFNSIYEAIRDNFQRLVTLQESVEEFSQFYEGWKILFSSVRGSSEDEKTTKLLQHIANEAGFHTEFAFVDEVEFSSEDGIFYNEEMYEYWFKLIPWEDIAVDEGELALILEDILKNQKAIILNPAYTLLFQSKGILKILWDLFPNHPLLLESSFEPLSGKKYVSKPCFGREGENVTIYNALGEVIEKKDGIYGSNKLIYQEYTQLNEDDFSNSYQAGVFFAYEGCGLGFRRGGKIIDNMSKFVSHMVKV
jgi:glutathionylspermidine synthase